MPEFTSKAIERIKQAVYKIESTGTKMSGKRARYTMRSPITAPIKVTSVSADGNGLYAGTLQLYNSDTYTFSNLEDCKIESNNGGLVVNNIYNMRLVGYDGDTDKLIWHSEAQIVTPSFTPSSGVAGGILTDNSGFCIQTRSSPISISSGGFTADRWYVETENNGVDYTAETASPYANNCCYARFTKTGSTGQFLVCQFLPHCPYSVYQNRTLSFQYALNPSKAMDVRVGFFDWTGTADAIPGTLVSSWAYPLPTWSAGLLSSTGSIAFGGTGWFNFYVWTAGFSFENVGLLLLMDDMASGDYIEMSQCYMTPGNSQVDYFPPSPVLDELHCAEYFGGVFN